MSKLTELLWYELGDGLNATDVDEAATSLKALFLELLLESVDDDFNCPVVHKLRRKVKAL